MDLNNVPSAIIIVTVPVAVVLAVGSFMRRKLRERRRPREAFDASKENDFFERFVLKPTSGQSGEPL